MSANIPKKYRIAAADELVTRWVAVEDLYLDAPNWKNPRTFTGLDRLALQKLGQSLLDDGPKVPLRVQRVIVTSEEDGEPVEINLVIDGQRRTRAAQIACPPGFLLPVVDIISSDAIELTEEIADILLDDSMATSDREQLSSFELVEVAAHMKGRGKKGTEIADKVRRSPSWVSKMLAAWEKASDKLRQSFKRGEVTDEMFKDLAASTDQDKTVGRVLEARAAGDKTEARTRAKEAKVEAKASKTKPMDAPGPEFAPREQREMFDDSRSPLTPAEERALAKDAGELAKPAKPKAPPVAARAVLEDLLETLQKRPGHSDYIRGLRDATAFALGLNGTEGFAKAFHEYLVRIDGAPVAKAAKSKKGK